MGYSERTCVCEKAERSLASTVEGYKKGRGNMNHIFEKVNPEMAKLGYECKCLGGGKIDHNSKDKKIRVFGLSTGYGKADHSVTVEILKKVYTDYEITWSDDKK
nr:PREDICTED: 14 kDa phosphohistidine phosphatase-like [Opisthocomus hoazin]